MRPDREELLRESQFTVLIRAEFGILWTLTLKVHKIENFFGSDLNFVLFHC